MLATGLATQVRPTALDAPEALIELEPGITVLGYIINAFREVDVVRDIYRD
jgi:NDP-sugar pyrophosphorylase family protein